MHYSGISYQDSSATPVFPLPFRAERSYWLYIEWVDTAGYMSTDSIGLMIPAVNKMEGIDSEIGVP